jgi:hypothetical protein
MYFKRAFLMISFVAVLDAEHSAAQTLPPVVLDVTIENVRFYLRDVIEPARLASSQSPVEMLQSRNFPLQEGVGDITEVNGTPARGTLTLERSGMILGPDPSVQTGLGIGDTGTRHGGRLIYEFNILDTAGRQIGTIFAMGNNQIGSVPPGAPPKSGALNMAVIGGTGAYLGARGQVTAWAVPGDPILGSASMVEDPGNRRIHGGGIFRRLIHLIPMQRPQIVASGNRPAIFHSDFTAVTETRPAERGEVLIAMATDLGPTGPACSAMNRSPLIRRSSHPSRS